MCRDKLARVRSQSRQKVALIGELIVRSIRVIIGDYRCRRIIRRRAPSPIAGRRTRSSPSILAARTASRIATIDRMSTYTEADVAAHAHANDCWVIIDDGVYDLTKFAKFHPGGAALIVAAGGQDATEAFYGLHRAEILEKMAGKYKIGVCAGKRPRSVEAYGALSRVPYAEPSAFQGAPSPYYDESHVRFREAVRAFYDEHIRPDMVRLDDAGTSPSMDVFAKLGEAGMLATRLQPGPWMMDCVKNCGMKLPGGIAPEKFDTFHELIAHEELGRLGVPGYCDGLGAGFVIGIPPVLMFARPEIRQKIGRETIMGKKTICLAISDPFAGSDVASIQCTATKTPCGKFYIVNGVKKWITNGAFADYFTLAVRTGGKGFQALSLIVVERGEGVETTKIKTSYSPAAGTAYIIFENVKVPVENLLGREGDGFKLIMHNFNHERWMIVAGTNGAMRNVIKECYLWAAQRKVFGKPLLEQAVIRNKLARMTSQLEAVQCWTEAITYQMGVLSHEEQAKQLAGPIALLKFLCTRVANFVADESAQIFGGRAITRTGMGRVIEGFNRAHKFSAILGGSEEVMADLGTRQVMKQFPDAKL